MIFLAGILAGCLLGFVLGALCRAAKEKPRILPPSKRISGSLKGAV